MQPAFEELSYHAAKKGRLILLIVKSLSVSIAFDIRRLKVPGSGLKILLAKFLELVIGKYGKRVIFIESSLSLAQHIPFINFNLNYSTYYVYLCQFYAGENRSSGKVKIVWPRWYSPYMAELDLGTGVFFSGSMHFPFPHVRSLLFCIKSFWV